MRKICAKWIPNYLNANQKREGVEASRQRFTKDVDFLSPVDSMEETWENFYEPGTKQQQMERNYSGFPRPKEFRVQNSARKVPA